MLGRLYAPVQNNGKTYHPNGDRERWRRRRRLIAQQRKAETMGNSFDIKGVSGTSTSHNSQPGAGGQKPAVSMKGDQLGQKPPKKPDGGVPMPK